LGLRRRRKKLTTVITSIDRRLRSMESYTIPTRIARKTITAAEIADGVIPPSDPKDSGATGSTSGTSAPTEFAVISAATYSAKNLTGSADWVEVTTATPHGYAKGDKVTIFGLNNNLVNADGTFTVSEQISDTVFRYSPSLNGFYSSVVTLATSATVTQRSRTTAVATLKLSSTSHGFNVGEVVTVSAVDDAYNGTFFIASVSGDTITYKFESETTSSEATTTSTGSVNAVTHKFAIIGDTWIDTSATPSSYKVWNGLKWTDSSNVPAGTIVNDGVAPSAPTGLSATQNGYYDESSGGPKIAISLKWNAPTTNADNTPLRDLGGYKVFYKYAAGVVDTGSAGDGSTNTTTLNSDGTLTGTFSYAANERGSASTVTLTTSAGTIQPSTYSIAAGASGNLSWTVSGLSDAQEVTVSWSTSVNGYGDITGTTGSTNVVSKNNYPAADWRYDIFGNTSITDTTNPTAADPVGGGPAAAATDWNVAGEVSAEVASYVIRDINVSSSVIFAVQAFDSSKLNYSIKSDELTVSTGKPALVLGPLSKPDVVVRLGTATITWNGSDSGGNATPPSLDHVEVHIGSTSGFTPGDSTYKGAITATGAATGNFIVVDGLAYNSQWYAKFVAVSTTGVKASPSPASDLFTITPLVDTDLIANTLTTWPFAGKVVSAGSLADGSINASSLLGPNVVTQAAISANAIGADQIAAGAIIAGKIGANAITANTIAAGAITAGKIDANAITADNIQAGAISASKITADAIDGKIITGATVRTAAAGARVLLDSSGFYAYNSGGTQTFKIDSSTGTVTIGSYAPATSNDLAGKISNGGAAADVNNPAYTTTITGTKITPNSVTASQINADSVAAAVVTANTVTSQVMSGSKYVEFSGAGGTDIVRLGYGTGSYAGAPGVAIIAGGTYVGWAGSWGSGDLEVGTNYYDCYLDFFRSDNSIIMRGQTVTLSASPLSTGVTGYMNLDSLRLTQTGAMTVKSSNSSAFRVESLGGAYHMSLNAAVGGVADYARLYVDPKNTARVGLQVEGVINHYGTVNLSSRRFKEDIKPYESKKANDLVLDVGLVTYKYLNKDGTSNPEAASQLGVIAEEILDLGLDNVVLFDDDGVTPKGVDYTKFGLLLIPVVRDLKAQILELQNRLGA